MLTREQKQEQSERLRDTLSNVSTLFLLDWQVRNVLDHGGLPWAQQRSTQSSDVLYRWAESSDFAQPFVAPPFRSPTVVTIDIARSAIPISYR